MYWNNDTRGIYGTLPMQAALHLYLPHEEETGDMPHRDLSFHRPDDPRRQPFSRKQKRTQFLW